MSPPTPAHAPNDGRFDLWAERSSGILRWSLTAIAGIAALDLAISAVSDAGTSLGPLRLGIAAFAVAGLLSWWRFDAVAVGLIIPLGFSVAIGDAGAGVFFLPVLLGALAATASGGFLLAALGLSVLWIATVPLFAPQDSPAIPLVVLLELAAVGLGLSSRVRAVHHDQDQARLALTRASLAEQAQIEQRAVEDVRRSVARDLHDVVAHGLTVIKLQADVALYASDLERARDALGRISDASGQSLTDLRVMLRLLQAPDATRTPQGLGGAADESASTLRLDVTVPHFRDTLIELGCPTEVTMDDNVSRLTRGRRPRCIACCRRPRPTSSSTHPKAAPSRSTSRSWTRKGRRGRC